MIIVFSGLDGTGKTSICQNIAEYLRSRKHRVCYFHMIKNSFSYILLNLNFAKKFKKGVESEIRNDKKSIKKTGLGFIKKCLMLVHALFCALRFMRYKKNPHVHVLCDRYTYDDIVHLQYLGLGYYAFSLVYRWLMPKPDLVFYFSISPEVAYKRKPEFAIEYFQQKAVLYDAFFAHESCIKVPQGSAEQNFQLITEVLDKELNSEIR